MEPIRADQEQVGGATHKPMYERLMLAEYAIADITGANPDVYYELGIRHALRPRSTVLLFAAGTPPPFDLAPLRGLPYRLDASGSPTDADTHVAARLTDARHNGAGDSALFKLVEGMPRPDVDHVNTDMLRERAEHSREY